LLDCNPTERTKMKIFCINYAHDKITDERLKRAAIAYFVMLGWDAASIEGMMELKDGYWLAPFGENFPANLETYKSCTKPRFIVDFVNHTP